MENTEEIYQALEEFSKKKHKVIPRELDEYLHFVARTGDPVYQWGLIKQLFKEKFLCVITDYYETSPGIDIPNCPNVDVFNYETMKNSLLEKIDGFGAAPFTIQRICELLTSPRKQYSRIDKFMRAFEKNILVVSTREPGHLRNSDSDIDNSDPREALVNGSDNSTDYNVDVDMDDMTSWKQNTDTDSTETYAVHHTTNMPTTDKSEEYSMHNGPPHRDIETAERVDSGKEEGEEKEPQPSTSNEEEEKMDEEESDKEKNKSDSPSPSHDIEDNVESGDDNKISEPEEEVDVDKIGETSETDNVQEAMEGDDSVAAVEDKPHKSPIAANTEEEELPIVEEDKRKVEEDDRNMDTGETEQVNASTPPSQDSNGETEHISVDVEDQSKIQEETEQGMDAKEEEEESSPEEGKVEEPESIVSQDDKTSSGDETAECPTAEEQPSPIETTSEEEIPDDKVTQSPEEDKPVVEEEVKKIDVEEKKETTEDTTSTVSSTAAAPTSESSEEDEKEMEKVEDKKTEIVSEVSNEVISKDEDAQGTS